MEKDESMLLAFQKMWCEMNTECMRVIVRETQHSGTMPTFTLPFQLQNSHLYTCQLPDEVLKSCPLGFDFAKHLQNYFHQLRWDHHQPPTNCLELYIDFSLCTSSVVPVKVDPDPLHPKVEKFELPDLNIAADSFSTPLVVQSRTWVRAIKWLIKVWDGCPLQILHQCKGALSMVGYTMPMCCVQGAPGLRMQTSAREHLWNYFHVNEASCPVPSPSISMGSSTSMGWAVSSCLRPFFRDLLDPVARLGLLNPFGFGVFKAAASFKDGKESCTRTFLK